jgi:hypothetical protein
MLHLENKQHDAFLKGEVRRLSGLRGFPTTTPAKTELKRALANAKTLDHASATINRILTTALFCPSPAEVRQALESTPTAKQASAGCERCHGSGWWHQPMENSTHGCQVCCSCAAGDLKRDILRASGARVMGGRG